MGTWLPMRFATAGVGAALVVALATVPGDLAVARSSAQNDASPRSRSFELRDITLESSTWVAISLHPNASPIELRSSQRGLEACPASYDGDLPEAGNGSSWPSFAGFATCLAFDPNGRVTLPSTVSSSFHLAFLVRSRSGERMTVEQLGVDYEPTDRYLKVRTPPVEPRRRSARLVITPTVSTTIGVSSSRSYDERLTPTLRVTVRQDGRRLRGDSEATARDRAAYGPATLGEPVSVRASNTGRQLTPVFITVDWS